MLFRSTPLNIIRGNMMRDTLEEIIAIDLPSETAGNRTRCSSKHVWMLAWPNSRRLGVQQRVSHGNHNAADRAAQLSMLMYSSARLWRKVKW